MEIAYLLIGAILGGFAVWYVARRILERRFDAERADLVRGVDELVREARRDSVKRSRHTVKGQINEQLAPLLPGFEFDLSDARFLGNPIDYVVFSGYRDLRDGQGHELEEIVFVEVKRGPHAKLSTPERRIRDCVNAKRVRWQTVVMQDDETEPVAHDATTARVS